MLICILLHLFTPLFSCSNEALGKFLILVLMTRQQLLYIELVSFF